MEFCSLYNIIFTTIYTYYVIVYKAGHNIIVVVDITLLFLLGNKIYLNKNKGRFHRYIVLSKPSLQRQHLFPKMSLKWICSCKEYLNGAEWYIRKGWFYSYFFTEHMI